MKILFVLKLRQSYGQYGHKASGLFNSATFVVDMLRRKKINAKLVQVVDNNGIDKEVHDFKPDVVVIEALWVVPEKFDILQKLHPKVKWIIRGHSDLPFLANEGVAVEWIRKYLQHRNVFVGFNSPRITKDFEKIFGRHKILYLPNFYPLKCISHQISSHVLKIGCFGAIRPLKNQLIQAVAAIRFADKIKRHLEFHINGTRCEGNGENILRNLRALFKNTGHKLIEHRWLSHDDFLQIVRKMNFVMAVSFSETFCITAADAVTTNTPLICSSEIPWASGLSIVSTTDTDAIVDKLCDLHYGWKFIPTILNRIKLHRYSAKSSEIWLDFIKRFKRDK